MRRKVTEKVSDKSFLVPLDESAKIELTNSLGALAKELVDEFRATNKQAQAEASEKLGALILPPLDRQDRAYMQMNDKERAKEMPDGGPKSRHWWAKVSVLNTSQRRN